MNGTSKLKPDDREVLEVYAVIKDKKEMDELLSKEYESGRLFNSKLQELYDKQVGFQKSIPGNQGEKIPGDSVFWFKYHMLAMMEELGEVLMADKRWKTHRKKYNKDEKLDELADVFITFLNLLIFSDIDISTILNVTFEKIDKNIARIKEEK